MQRAFLVAAAAAVALLSVALGSAQSNDAVAKGSAFIYGKLQADGSYGSTSIGQNLDAILAVRAAGYDPAKDGLPGAASPAEYFTANATGISGAAAAGKAALAAKALGLNPGAVGGVNLTAVVTASFNAGSGRYAEDDFSQSLAMLGLACTANSVEPSALTALKDAQIDNGGWGFGGFADPDTTAIAVQALLASGVPQTDPTITKALDYLTGSQAADGGWGFDGVGNANSTAFVVQALLALGLDPAAGQFSRDGTTPIAFLLSQQHEDGSFEGFDPLVATTQVVPALAGRTFCNAPDTPISRQREQSPATSPTPSPSGTASPSTGAATPAPPATGTGRAGVASLPDLSFLAAAAFALVTTATALAMRRR